MSQIEIFSGTGAPALVGRGERRLVAVTLVPSATVHAVAQRHGVNTSQLFTWRKRFRTELSLPPSEPPVPAFAAVELAPAQGFSEAAEQQPVAEADAVTPVGVIEVELPQGGRVLISGAVEPAVVTAALRALVRRRSRFRRASGSGWRAA